MVDLNLTLFAEYQLIFSHFVVQGFANFSIGLLNITDLD